MMFAIVGISTDSLDTKNRVLKEDREMLSIQMAFSIFDWDFSQIYSPLFFSSKYVKKNEHNEESVETMMERFGSNPNFDGPDKDGLPIPILVSENKKEFLFFTSSNRRRIEDQSASSFAWVKYKIITTEKDDQFEHDTGQAFARVFSAVNPFGSEKFDEDKIKPQILIKNVKEVKFEFWNPESKKFVEGLDSVPEGKFLIRGLKLTIVWIDKNGSEIEDSRIFRVNWPSFDPSKDIKATATGSDTDPNNDYDPNGDPANND
jgi:hypothetical protein